MKTTMIAMMMAGIVTFSGAAEPQKIEPQRIELPKSGSLILTSTFVENAFQYELVLKTAGGTETKLSSVKILDPRGGRGLPDEQRYLISCDENPEMVVALLGEGIWILNFLQYDLTTKTVKEERLWAEALLKRRGITNGGTLSVHAPNQITLSGSDGTSQSWSIVDGKFIDESGNVFAQDESRAFIMSVSETPSPAPPASPAPSSVVEPVPPPSKDKAPPEATPVPTPAPNENPFSPISSAPRSVIAVLIMAALGLLWFLFKRSS